MQNEAKMVIALSRWEIHRHEKGAEIVNQAGPYGPGPWLELGSGIGNNTIPLSKNVDTLIALDVSTWDLLKLQQKSKTHIVLQFFLRSLQNTLLSKAYKHSNTFRLLNLTEDCQLFFPILWTYYGQKR